MRTDVFLERTAKRIGQKDVFRIEQAILQADVDIVGQRSPNAGKDLPCEVGVRIVDTGGAAPRDASFETRAGYANTTADKALKAIIGTEIGKAVHHERERIDLAAGGIDARTGANVRSEEARVTDSNLVDIGFGIARFGFDANRTEIVADETTGIEAVVVIDTGDVSGRTDVESRIFDDHRTCFHADVPSAVTCKGRRSKGRRGHRHSYDEFPHYKFPLLRIRATEWRVL